jgi:hypothetical protein
VLAAIGDLARGTHPFRWSNTRSGTAASPAGGLIVNLHQPHRHPKGGIDTG